PGRPEQPDLLDRRRFDLALRTAIGRRAGDHGKSALPRSFRHRHRWSAWSSRYWRGAATVKVPAITLGLLAAILVASAVLSLGVGAVSIPAGRVMQILVEPPVSG